MKFKYHKFNLSPPSNFFGKLILKPIIPLKVSRTGAILQYAALIDSGRINLEIGGIQFKTEVGFSIYSL
ncbi:hypothetical protein KKE78_01055 [Patescibacteria group bacterium]|nr:hypothetical protein [Patescibacteria group bacterium]